MYATIGLGQALCLFYGGCLFLSVHIPPTLHTPHHVHPSPFTLLTTYTPNLSHSSPLTPLTFHTPHHLHPSPFTLLTTYIPHLSHSSPLTPLTFHSPHHLHLSHSSPRTPLTFHTHIIGDLGAADCLENLSPPPVQVVDWLPWKPRNLPDEVADRL